MATKPTDPNDLAARIIEPSAFVADTEAFVDVRIERSKGKASYSFIGPGVSQNPDQVINLTIPHGFNVGAATMPAGIINNPHLHFTAEVFLCTRGSFRFDIGEHGEQSIDIGPGDVLSVPTWVFRGFQNTGGDDGWVFTVLGGDDTGGIIWAPHILAEAAETGMFLSPDYALLDATVGDDVTGAIQPFSPDELAGHLATFTDAELEARVVRHGGLVWSDRSLLSAVLPGHQSAMAPVIGHGMSQHRAHAAAITNRHGFSVEWLRVEPGSATGVHRHHETQATFLVDGDWQVDIDLDDRVERATPASGSIVSVPPSAWRNFSNIGDTAATAVVVCGSDAPVALEWPASTVDAARRAGSVIDAGGFIAPTHLTGDVS